MTQPAETWQPTEADAEAVARVLATLDPAEWTVYRDVRWPTREFASLDHVVVGPKGVFVIDSLGWSGRVNVAQDQLRVNGAVRDSELVGAAEAASALTRLIGSLDARHVQPVLCLVRDEWLTGTARGVLVCSTANLAAMLLGRSSHLRADQLRSANRQLERWWHESERPASRAVVAPVFAPVSTPATRRASPVLWLVLGAALVAVLAICVMTLGI